MGAAGPQADKGQTEDHGRTRAETKYQRPDKRLLWQQPQTHCTEGAHHGDQHRNPALIAQTRQN